MNSDIQTYVDERFDRFVSAVHDGRQPYQWQRRLMHYALEHAQWPNEIAAPTGAGKTMVMDIHVFLNALAGLCETEHAKDDADAELRQLVDMNIAHIPRRLVMTVNRRSLVDDQYEEAVRLASLLEDEQARAKSPILSEVAEGLIRRAGMVRDIHGNRQPAVSSPCRVTRLRGGEAADNVKNEWRYYPTQCQILCATPDMFGSRLLFRGYGISKAARPVEAGLFAYDTVLILDEAHLNRQLAQTATDVLRLEVLQKSKVAECVFPLQVVRTTATPVDKHAVESVKVDVEDFQKDSYLRRKLTCSKPVHLDKVECSDKEYAEHIARRCVELFDAHGGVVGCIVNTVDTAGKVADVLAQLLRKSRQYDAHSVKDAIRCFVGPMRAYDKNQLQDQGVFSAFCGNAEQDSALRFVIGTQTLEVGIDADFSALVTELAPGSSLVQRAGRVNRRGLRETGPIIVVVREGEKKRKGVYRPEDLDLALAWLRSLGLNSGSDIDLKVWNNVEYPAPIPDLDRMALQRLEIWDVENLSSTDERLAAEHESHARSPADINLWLRDDLSPETAPDIGVVVRDLPQDGAGAAQLVSLAPPVAEESFPIRSYGQLKDIGAVYTKSGERGEKDKDFGPLLIYRPSAEGKPLVWDCKTSLDKLVQPGDTLVVNTSVPLFNENIHVLDCSGGKANQTESDVYNQCQDSGWMLKGRLSDNGDGPYRILDNLDKKRAAIDSADTESDNDDSVMPTIQQIADELGNVFARKIFGSSCDSKTKIVVYPAIRTEAESHDQHDEIWMAIEPLANLDEHELQEIRIDGTDRMVYLNTSDGHQPCVERRASDLMKLLGFDESLCNEVADAGRHHDDGKKDWRFQRLLHYRFGEAKSYEDSTYLAKSHFRSVTWEQQKRNELNLAGWRHEQRSAAEYWASSDQTDNEYDTRLVTRLIGTSHGHGRSAFVASAGTVFPESVKEKDIRLNPSLKLDSVVESAQKLFDTGVWQTIVHQTDWKYGFWGVSYLEAILRASDITVSKEG
ncbi:type I-U CRISPR-associated helicase/endonuclease Cas3 [Bifidobacterium sp. ESL0690]|uniref:type I-G CRISPR-associated helicase/endonuclease Cas3g n=1 Tax=Bifidobacterium sp. ESL0690 TaxID=2983214 RepID=UPI0023F809F3|nr:type I-U CRISPR-associated helicase/endonuclease Cas3 [Bifidobacterium sp. ESL0690]WEV46100.1 type I-U CRISPR-associated helicase/endonuclease Cas3 [Bifidobacterium sp. ESL0690]